MAVILRKEEIDKTLATGSFQGKRLLEPLKSFAVATGFPVKILEDREVVNEAEVHENDGDLWQCLEGEVTFVCGGELVDKEIVKNGEWKAREINGGTEIVLKPGDWLWIPAGEPHQHKTSSVARLVIIKIPTK